MSLVSQIQSSVATRNSSFDCHKEGKATKRRLYHHQDHNDSPPPQKEEPLISFLHHEWTATIQGLGLEEKNKNGIISEAWFQRLWDLHCQPDRFYHTAVHLEEMLHILRLIVVSSNNTNEENTTNSICVSELDMNMIRLSIFFHDAIYNAKSATNEEDSAQLFEDFVQEMLATPPPQQPPTTLPPLALDIQHWIRATKSHTVSSDDDDDDDAKRQILSLFLDLDMAVLGKQEDSYLAYAALIRQEYNFVSATTYCEKRAQVLETFLQTPHIYSTHFFRDALERRARDNLTREIYLLRQGKIPQTVQETL